MPALMLTLYMIGYLSACTVFNVIYLHTPETMPTEVRAMGMSFSNACARIGGMLGPVIALMVCILVVLLVDWLDQLD